MVFPLNENWVKWVVANEIAKPNEMIEWESKWHTQTHKCQYQFRWYTFKMLWKLRQAERYKQQTANERTEPKWEAIKLGLYSIYNSNCMFFRSCTLTLTHSTHMTNVWIPPCTFLLATAFCIFDWQELFVHLSTTFQFTTLITWFHWKLILK